MITSDNPCDPSRSLWDFACDLYSKAGMEQLLLRLQDDHQVDINVLLWCHWLDCNGIYISAEILRSAENVLSRWNETAIVPLRKIRRAIKQEYGSDSPQIEAVRNATKHAELMAERYGLHLLDGFSCDNIKMPEQVRHGAKGNKAAKQSTSVNLYLQLKRIPAPDVFALNELLIVN